MKTKPVLGAIIVATLLLTACAKQEADSTDAASATDTTGSPVWAVRGEHNTVYLGGSVHALKAQDAKLPAAFDHAYADAQALVMELDPEADTVSWILEHGKLEQGRTLKDAIDAERYARVQAEATRLGLPMELLDEVKPWVAGIQLSQMQQIQLGSDSQYGVEGQLQRRARADGKPIQGIATLPEQMGALDGLSDEEQANFLDAMVTQMQVLEAETASMLSAWRVGDTRKLAEQAENIYKASPVLHQALLVERNRRWLPRVEKLLREKDNYFVVVGAAHLVGNVGLLEMLKRDGFEVRQLQ